MKELELETELSELRVKLEDLMEENDGLRKGMQEILDSVRNQDASSDVKIQAPEIERLLGILDARHLWGSYHPAMGLKNRIEQLEGINSGEAFRGAGCSNRSSSFCPTFVFVQILSYSCPEFVQILTKVCPCPNNVQVMSSIVQLLSRKCPPVQNMSFQSLVFV